MFEKQYKLIKKIGEGAFGKVYKAIKLDTEEVVAIKIEKKTDKNLTRLKHESRVYSYLKHTVGFPKMYYFL